MDDLLSEFGWFIAAFLLFGMWALVHPQSFGRPSHRSSSFLPNQPPLDRRTVRGLGIFYMMVAVALIFALGLYMYVRSRN